MSSRNLLAPLLIAGVLICSRIVAAKEPHSMGEYGKAVSIQETSVVEFPDFTLTYLKQTRHDGAPATVSVSHRTFKITDQHGGSQTLSVSFGQRSPAPVDFKVGNHQFTLFTYEYPRGERLFPDRILVNLKK